MILYNYFSQIVGYSFGLFIAEILILFNKKALERKNGSNKKSTFWDSSLLSILERIIYISALRFGQFGFIAIWLTLKAIPELTNKKSDQPFNYFMIENAFSLIFAFAGYKIIYWLELGLIPLAIFTGLALTIGSFISYATSREFKK